MAAGNQSVIVTDSNGCTSLSSTNIPFKPSPIGTNVTENLTCESLTFSVDLQALISNGISSNFTWTVNNNTNVDGELSGSGDFLTGGLINKSGVPQTVIYNVTPIAAESDCVGVSFTILINLPVCAGMVVVKSATFCQTQGLFP